MHYCVVGPLKAGVVYKCRQGAACITHAVLPLSSFGKLLKVLAEVAAKLTGLSTGAPGGFADGAGP